MVRKLVLNRRRIDVRAKQRLKISARFDQRLPRKTRQLLSSDSGQRGPYLALWGCGQLHRSAALFTERGGSGLLATAC